MSRLGKLGSACKQKARTGTCLGIPSVGPLTPCSSEGHHGCPNPSLPVHRGLCSPPPLPSRRAGARLRDKGLVFQGPGIQYRLRVRVRGALGWGKAQ